MRHKSIFQPEFNFENSDSGSAQLSFDSSEYSDDSNKNVDFSFRERREEREKIVRSDLYSKIVTRVEHLYR